MDIGIYIHIPFCLQKCGYCDFLSFPVNQCKGQQEPYVQALCNELKAYGILLSDCEVATIYLGGGTPSILEEHLMLQIMNTLWQNYKIKEDAEITIECNPGTTSYSKFLAYKEFGINRLSIGLQSTNNEMLKRIGRVHTFETFLKQYEEARKAGFANINVDLISALPGQTREDYKNDVQTIIRLSPEHISSYSLIIEEDTPFAQNQALLDTLPEEEEAVYFYQQTKVWLEEAGYQRYEISNYAKPGYESQHNSSYWTGIPYLGAGLGASSYLVLGQRHIRFHNETDMQCYIKERQNDSGKSLSHWRREEELLSREDRIEEFMFLGLRRMKGVSYSEFARRFGCSMKSLYADVIDRYENQQLLRREQIEGEQYLALTEEGIAISNQIFVDFMLN